LLLSVWELDSFFSGCQCELMWRGNIWEKSFRNPFGCFRWVLLT